jgi:predicted nucleic acid-binding protein
VTPRRWAYFDTSALVKRYVKEAGSSATRRLLQRFRLLSSAVTPVEVMSALSRRRTAGELTAKDFLAIRARVLKDRAYWEPVEVGVDVLQRVEGLVQKTDIRTLDALHVASAMIFQGASGLMIPFITSDAKQRDAAHAMALTVIWVD